MNDLTIEDTVILWDCSRSMVRSDYKPSRYRFAQKAIRVFIEKKLSIDAKDSIAIVQYGSITKKVSDFSGDPEKLIERLQKKKEILGKSNLADAIAFALQLLVKQIQKLGGKVPRIFIVTDNNRIKYTERLRKLIKLAQGLGVFVDVCSFKLDQKYSPNPLKDLAYQTNAEYAFFNNPKAVLRAAEGFASKKILKETEDYFDPNKKNQLPPLISEIAVDLRRPGINEIREMMHGKVDHKCQICYQNKCPTCKSPFYGCGRFCPSCGRPIHLHCASKWAEQSEFSESNVFRCPFCYFLLKVPKSVQQLLKVSGNSKGVKIIDEDISAGPVKMTKVPSEFVEDIDDACAYCNNIFSKEGEDVYKCSGCASFYHESCLNKMYNEIKACRVCGGTIGKE